MLYRAERCQATTNREEEKEIAKAGKRALKMINKRLLEGQPIVDGERKTIYLFDGESGYYLEISRREYKRVMSDLSVLGGRITKILGYVQNKETGLLEHDLVGVKIFDDKRGFDDILTMNDQKIDPKEVENLTGIIERAEEIADVEKKFWGFRDELYAIKMRGI